MSHQNTGSGKSPLPTRLVSTEKSITNQASDTNQSPASAKTIDQVCISREEVEQAFAFFDVSNSGTLKPRDLKARLSAFYPNMTNKEYRFLISEPNFTVETLWSLLENATITNFDPVQEAFRVYDPHKTGFVDIGELQQIMSRMGYGEMTQDDMDILIKTADIDGDGKISLDDFRRMLNFNKTSASK